MGIGRALKLSIGGASPYHHTGRMLDQCPMGPPSYPVYGGVRICQATHDSVTWMGTDQHCWFCGKLSVQDWEYHDLVRQGLA